MLTCHDGMELHGQAALVHLHHAVDLPDEPEAGEEPDGACEQEEAEDHDGGVAEVEEGGGRAHDVQLGDKVVHAVHRQIEGSEP